MGAAYHVIRHRDEQIKEDFPAGLHLHLHCAAPLEHVSAADDESEVVCTQLGVAVGGVSVCIPSRRENRAALDTRLETLFAEGEALKFGEAVLFSRALRRVLDMSSWIRALGETYVDDGVFQNDDFEAVHEDCALHCSRSSSHVRARSGFKLPASPSLVELKLWVVVTLVEILENR